MRILNQYRYRGAILSHIVNPFWHTGRLALSNSRVAHIESHIDQHDNLQMLNLWPSMTSWANVENNDRHPSADLIVKAESVRQLMEIMSSKQFLPDCQKRSSLLRLFCRRLLFRSYTDLERRQPFQSFLSRDIHSAFKQFSDCSSLESVSEHARLVRLVTAVESCADNFEFAERNEILLAILYLGESKFDSLVRRLYIASREELSRDNKSLGTWFDISTLLDASQALGLRDHRLLRLVVDRIDNTVTDNYYADSRDILYFLKSIGSVSELMSVDLSNKLTQKVIEIFSNETFMSRSENVRLWTTTAVQMLKSASEPSWYQIEKCLQRLSKYTSVPTANFTLMQANSMLHNLKNIYPANAPTLFDFTALIGDASDVDDMPLKDLLIAVAYLGELNTDCSRLSQLTARLDDCTGSLHTRNGLKLVDYSLIIKILASATKQQLSNKLKNSLRSLLVRGLDTVADLDEFSCAHLFVYDDKTRNELRQKTFILLNEAITQRRQSALLAVIFINLQGHPSKWLEPQMYSLLETFDIASLSTVLDSVQLLEMHRNRLHLPRQAAHSDNTGRSDTVIDCAAVASEVTSIVYQVAGDYLNGQHDRSFNSPVFTDELGDYSRMVRLMEMTRRSVSARLGLMRALEHVTQIRCCDSTVESIGYLLRQRNLFAPRIMERLVDYVLDNTGDVTQMSDYTMQQVKDVLLLCNKFLYKSARFNELCDVSLRMFDTALSRGLYDHCVTVLLVLAHFNRYPRSAITQLFSEQHLQSALQYSSEEEHGSHVYTSLQKLSKSVHLHKPELGVRMLGQENMNHRQTIRFSNKSLKSIDAIYKALIQVCGGDIFVNRYQSTDYGCVMDFKVMFDSTIGVPVCDDDEGIVSGSDGDGIERIAIITLPRSAFASNQISLLMQQYASRKRDLQAQGYDVILVMRNCRYDKLQEGLHQAIFSSSASRRKMGVIR